MRSLFVRTLAIASISLLWIAGCGDPAGTPCNNTGSGFHAKDPCRYQCLSRWSLTCPDGAPVTPAVCTGSFDCTPGSCPDGQLCYHDDDPFDDRSFCVPNDVCGAITADAAAAWELATLARQKTVIQAREDKAARRTATTPAPSSAGPANQHSGALPPLPCEPDANLLAARIEDEQSEAGGPIVIAAGERFVRTLPHDWHFVLEPETYGFSVRLFDRPEAAGAVDLSVVTPPLRGPTNARHIAGWHFRNAANTGPNTGDVNAPQHLRLFQFEPALIGTAPDAEVDTFVESAPGRGWLRIEELTLSPPVTGERASVQRMAFRACLTWPRPSDGDIQRWQRKRETSRAAMDAQRLEFDDTDRELFGRCGLDFEAVELSARITPRAWELDIDGDGAIDRVAQVVRQRDGRRGLALCRAGTWLDWVDQDHAVARAEAVSSTLEAMEQWRVEPGDRGKFGFVDEPEWPAPDGDILVLERPEKSLVALYFEDGALRAHIGFRLVEP